MEINKLYNADFKQAVKYMKKDSIDLIIADPLYKIDSLESRWGKYIKNFFRKEKGRNVFNYLKAKEYMSELCRVLKPSGHIYVYTDEKNMLDILQEADKVGFKLMNIIVLDKEDKIVYRWFMKQVEFVLLFIKDEKNTRMLNSNISNLISVKSPRGKNKIHSSEKSVEIGELFIKQSSSKNDVIFIPFAGIASGIIACLNTERNYIAFEEDKSFYQLAFKRIGSINSTYNKIKKKDSI